MMRVEFVTAEHKHEQIGADLWQLREPFVARVTCEEWPEPLLIVVPGGYKTDFESVPRVLLLAYWLIKGKARRSATLHDYLLDLINGKLAEAQRTLLLPFVPPREWIDRLFYSAMIAEETNAMARELAYMGVTAYTAFLNSRGAANGGTA